MHVTNWSRSPSLGDKHVRMKRYILLIVLVLLSIVGTGECASVEPNSLYGLRLGAPMHAVQTEADKQKWSLVEEFRGSPFLLTREYRDKRTKIYVSFSNDRLFRITLYLNDDHPSETTFNGFMKDLTDEYGQPQVIATDTNYEWHIERVIISLSRYSDSYLKQHGLSQICELELRVNQPAVSNLEYF